MMTIAFKNAIGIIDRAFWEVYAKKLCLAKGLISHVVILAFCSILLHQAKEAGFWVFLAVLPAIYSYTLLAINTHRIVLLNPMDLPQNGEFSVTVREFKFIGYGIGIALLCIPCAFLIGIPIIGYPLFIIGVAYLSARLSLVLPATAIDQNWSLQDAWIESKSCQVTMMIVIGLFPFIASLPETLIGYIPYSSAIVFLISILTTIYTIAALSMAFEYIQSEEQTH